MSISTPQPPLVWNRALAVPATEFPLTPLKVLSGRIPDGLNGTLYRNGPARLKRGDRQVGHWFDGDGAILAVHFAQGAARGVYRYVQTAGYLAESAVDRFLYGGYGMTAPGWWWERFGKPIKNAANTSVLALPDKLLALWEGGYPHALDLETLETIGTENLGFSTSRLIYSAHPKVDPKNGDIYNFGISVGAEIGLNLYRSDRTGKIIQHTVTKLDRISVIHDFIFADKYLVIFAPPIAVNLLPLLFKLKSYGESIRWQSDLGMQILVFDRENLQLVSQNRVESWFHWHIANGYVDNDGNIVCSIARYADFATNTYLKEVPTGQTQTKAISNLWEITINPQTAKLIRSEKLTDHWCEFPVVPRVNVGQNWRYTYLSLQKTEVGNPQDLFSTIGRYDRVTQTLAIAKLEEYQYASEPIHIQDRNCADRGWIITVVYDGKEHQSQVWIYDRDRVDDQPLCRISLPGVIPMGFHGTWLD